MFGNKLITRDGSPIVRSDILPSGYNSAAIGGQPKWNGGYNFTSVGTNGISSAYGTFDQTGNGFEWIDGSGSKVIRGGDIYGLGTAAGGYECSKLTRYTKTVIGSSANPSLFTRIANYLPGRPQNKDFGGRLASSGNPLGLPGYVTVGNTGNAADTTGYGRVDYGYQINKYKLTNDEYCNFLNAVATTPTSASTKDVCYGITNQNVIYEINLTDKTSQPVFDTKLVGVITNSMAFDTVNKVVYFFDNNNNMYSWDLGSTLTLLGNINTIASLGANSYFGEGVAGAAYYDAAIWIFNPAGNNKTQLVKIALNYSSSNVPSVGTITKYSTNISGINNLFGDFSINSSGILYGNTTYGEFYSLNVNSPSNSFSLKRTGLVSLQNVFNRDYTVLYTHNYMDGVWSTINLTNGNLTSASYTAANSTPTADQPGYGFRDLCGPNSIVVYSNVYSYQMNSERAGGINRSYNPNTNTFSYSVKTNYGNKPAYFLSWFDMARYSNWLHNNYGSLETGAYTLSGTMIGIIEKNPGATYWVPSENEWYKAAYYKGSGTNAGYWKFATRSDSTPIEVDASNIGDGTVKKIVRYLTLPTGINVSTSSVTDPVNNNTVSFIFDRVLTTGTTTVTAQPRYAKPGLPANFYLSNTLSSYVINTTASYSGNITVRYTLPSTISSGNFSNIKIFHKNSSNGKFEDATIATGIYAKNFATKTIAAIVSNFSPFEVVPEETPSATGLVLDTDIESSTYNTYINLSSLNSPTGVPSGSAGDSSISGLSLPPVTNSSAWGRRILVPDPDNSGTFIESIFNVDASNDTVIMPVNTGNVTFQYAELTPGVPGQVGIAISTVSSPSSNIIVVTDSPYSDPSSGGGGGTTPSVSPVAYYAFENNANDSVGSNHGTSYNTPQYTTGRIGNCVNFTGGSSYITIPAVVSTDFTVSFFVKTTQNYTTDGDFFMGCSLLNGEESGMDFTDWGITYLANKIAFGAGYTGGTSTFKSTSTVNNGQWRHVCCTRNSSTGAISIYIDGVLETTGSGPTGARTAPSVLHIGNNKSLGETFSGQIDNMKIYNQVLSSSEITWLANETTFSTSSTGQATVISWE
jgi:hypothetical protein